MKEKLHKYSFLGCLLLAGIVFFTWTDNWQVYTEPLQETYTKGVLLAEQLVEGKWPGISGEQSDATGSVSGNVPGENVQTGDTVSDGNQTDQTMGRSEEHTSDQSLTNLVCRLLLEKKKKNKKSHIH